MERVDEVNQDLTQIFASKERRRKALAGLPFPAKVEAVVKLQEMASPILRSRGKLVRPWAIRAASEKTIRRHC
jgi:hypothetical protein